MLDAAGVFVQRKWQEARGIDDERIPALVFAGSREDATRGMAELADVPQVLVRAVLRLPEPYRSTVIDRYYHGRSAVFIAGREGVTAGAVRNPTGAYRVSDTYGSR